MKTTVFLINIFVEDTRPAQCKTIALEDHRNFIETNLVAGILTMIKTSKLTIHKNVSLSDITISIKQSLLLMKLCYL